MWNKYFVASTAQRAKYSVRYRLIDGQKKIRKGLMLEGTNSRCPIHIYIYIFLPKLAGEIAGQRNGTFSTVNHAVFLRR